MYKYLKTEYGNLAFDGGPETGEALTWIGPTGYTSPRKAAKQNENKTQDTAAPADRISVYFTDRGYGFTRGGVYFHEDDVISGTPREGAKIEYTTRETPRGLRAKNVYILN